jgi:hypothetical protein
VKGEDWNGRMMGHVERRAVMEQPGKRDGHLLLKQALLLARVLDQVTDEIRRRESV